MTAFEPIYLDHNATTPLLPEVVESMLPYLRDHFGNPSSSHPYGERPRRAVARAREQVAAVLGCQPDEIVFTSGGTEANNMAIHAAIEAAPERRGVVTSAIEHPAIEQPCEGLGLRGYSVTRLGVDAFGRIGGDEALDTIGTGTALVTVMHANNETGVLQPIGDLARRAREMGAVVHTDAAQSIGKVSVDVGDLDVDLLTVAGHKLYAPKGVGALYVRRGLALAPLIRGAGHEGGRRPGTENVPSIVGLGAACAAMQRDFDQVEARMRTLRDDLWARLKTAISGLALNGHPEYRLPNTLNVRFPEVTGDAVLRGAPEIAASTGSACHEGQSSASTVILAMGVSPEEALGSTRLSLGRATTAADVAAAAAALIRSWRACT